MINYYNNLIVGCGITGAVIAERFASQFGQTSLIIDKKNHIAGNCYDYKESDITVHQYGPHIFHTNIERVWKYLSQFTKWHTYMHTVLAYIDGNLVPIPFNFNSIEALFPRSLAQKLEYKLLSSFEYNIKVSIMELMENSDDDIKFLANFIYENVFKNYTMKQWGLKLEDIDSSVTARVPVSISKDNRYFGDIYQGIPSEGYTEMIKNIITHEKITVQLNTDFNSVKDKVKYDKLFYTGSIDEYFDYKFGRLPYRSLNFSIESQKIQDFQPVAVVNYPNNYDFTRITEFKHFLSEKSEKTIIMKEFPQEFKLGENERLYPISNQQNNALYDKYMVEAERKNVIFAGRLGRYKYYDMDKAVAEALNIVERLIGKDYE